MSGDAQNVCAVTIVGTVLNSLFLKKKNRKEERVNRVHLSFPDELVMLGNHRDAWIFGAADPSSGTAAMMELSRVLGEQLKKGTEWPLNLSPVQEDDWWRKSLLVCIFNTAKALPRFCWVLTESCSTRKSSLTFGRIFGDDINYLRGLQLWDHEYIHQFIISLEYYVGCD